MVWDKDYGGAGDISVKTKEGLESQSRSGSKRHPGIVSLTAFGCGGGLGVLQALAPTWFGSLVDSLLYGVTGLVIILTLSRSSWVNTVFQTSKRSMTSSEVQLRAFFLGWGVSCGIRCITSEYSVPLGAYIIILCAFHYTEFFVTSYTSPETLSLDSFLLNHSKEYGIAALASMVEFFVEFYFIPDLKSATQVCYIGIGICMVGELLRKSAMFTASTNFTHLIRDRKAEGQYLVTTGPYALCRHPGYAGWFCWSIGTQLIMINPFCAIAYAVASHRFFRDRIYYEEICLLSFFGLDYINYQEKVPRTGVPLVPGCRPFPLETGDETDSQEEDEAHESDSLDGDSSSDEYRFQNDSPTLGGNV